MTASIAQPLLEFDPARPMDISALYGKMWKHSQGVHRWLLLSSFMLMASQIVKLVVPWCTAQAIYLLRRDGPDAPLTCLKWIAAIVGIYVVSWRLHAPRE